MKKFVITLAALAALTLVVPAFANGDAVGAPDGVQAADDDRFAHRRHEDDGNGHGQYEHTGRDEEQPHSVPQFEVRDDARKIVIRVDRPPHKVAVFVDRPSSDTPDKSVTPHALAGLVHMRGAVEVNLDPDVVQQAQRRLSLCAYFPLEGKREGFRPRCVHLRGTKLVDLQEGNISVQNGPCLSYNDGACQDHRRAQRRTGNGLPAWLR